MKLSTIVTSVIGALALEVTSQPVSGVQAGCAESGNSVHKREIPYGGIISFGNSQANIQALQPQSKPCPEKVAKSGTSRGSLLGLVDIDLGVHL
ncbi:hypothetical protein BX667DRAFT_64467 [Coemansia mojavensis]|nr:hypothetical protein BX667DRAFT_64467 [Coemansia mojavensis]